MNGQDAAMLRESLSKRAAALHENFARELAAAGWTFYGMRGGITANFGSDVTARNHTNSGAEVIVAGSSEPLQDLATATGGSVQSDPRKFALTIDRMRNRVRFTYQVSRPADGVPRRVEVRARRAGLEVHAPRWSASSSSDASAAARAGNLLDGINERGELPVDATFQLEGDQRKLTNGALAVRASFKPLAAVLPQLTGATVRVTVAVAIENGPPVVAHKLLRNVNLSRADNISVKVPVRTNKTKKIVVLVEELSTSVWGGTLVRVQ